ncbi:MAG: bifunctional phosphoribosyl-AMP cyclohydrolase/phosphoribosyl-ATP diphosphatase HisIE [Acetatifactor sp.]
MSNQQVVKKFVPCIYLHQGRAVDGLQHLRIVEENPLTLVQRYNECGADELIVFDLSRGDTEHEAALDLLKEICAVAEMDVFGAGNIKRMEDVKKLLYAGCTRAVLNYDLEGNVGITEEVSLKFGKEKIMASVADPGTVDDNRELAEKYLSGLILMEDAEVGQLASAKTSLPWYLNLEQSSKLQMMDILADTDRICGVTGNFVNGNFSSIYAWKQELLSKGVKVQTLEAALKWSELKKNSDGMVPVIVQDYRTSEVLMLAYMNEESYEKTLLTGKMTYYSRSRQELWLKGETSGHYQYVKSLTADCDMDTILAKVSQVGVACHTGARSCFFREIAHKEYEQVDNPLSVFTDVFNVIRDRKIHPKEGSYTNYLFDKGIDKILKKLGEEATEIVIAAKNPNPNEIKYEISDFLYHMMVLMVEKNVSWEDIMTELANR